MFFRLLSFTPGFSQVSEWISIGKPFKRFADPLGAVATWLKPVVNERKATAIFLKTPSLHFKLEFPTD